MSQPRKILLVRPDRLGDLILSLPVAKALKEHFRFSQVYYLVAPGPASLAKLVGYVDGWIVDQDTVGGRLSLHQLVAKLKAERFDIIIDLLPSWRTAVAGYFAAIPFRIGTSRRLYSVFYNRKINLHRRCSGRHQTDLDLALLAPLGVVKNGALPLVTPTAECFEKASSLVPHEAEPYVVIHPTCGGSASNWPLRNYSRLAAIISLHTRYKVVVTGQGNVGEGFEGCINLTGKTDLESLSGVIARAELFVSGSTGPLHLADSLGVRCASFYPARPDIGATRWGPRRNMNYVMTPNKTCRCIKLSRCRCLEQITPEAAFMKISDILKHKEKRAV